MKNFDGVEFDIRLSKDKELVIHHDHVISSKEIISELESEKLKSQGVPLLKDFFQYENARQQIKSGKALWIELKPNCNNLIRESQEISEDIFQSLMNAIDDFKVPRSSVKILSFSEELLTPFALEGDFPVYQIIPDINECSYKFRIVKALVYILRNSLTWHISKAQEKKYSGVLFARQYLMGLIRLRHPSYTKMKLYIHDGFELGTNLGNVDLESKYPLLHRFTDNTGIFPRFAKNGEGQIIAHRGTGIKGIKLLGRE